MATEFDDTEELHYVGFYTGTVTDDEDPEMLGRVRINIPGLIEPASAWSFPVGTLSGGSTGRGWFGVPAVGADVGVFFFHGDVDTLFYLPAHWGVDGGVRETPLQEPGLDKSSRTKVTGYETDRYQLMFDERSGNERILILDKSNGNFVELSEEDGITIKSVDKKVKIDAGGDVEVNAGGDVSVNGNSVNLNGPGPGVARLGDAVTVTIPPGVFHVTNPTVGPPTIPNPFPVPVPGTIVSSSVKVTSG